MKKLKLLLFLTGVFTSQLLMAQNWDSINATGIPNTNPNTYLFKDGEAWMGYFTTIQEDTLLYHLDSDNGLTATHIDDVYYYQNIIEDTNGNVWFLINEDNCYCFHARQLAPDGSITTYKSSEIDEMPQYGTGAMAAGLNGEIYISGNNGLSIFDNGTWTAIPEILGENLHTNFSNYQLDIMPDGRLWLNFYADELILMYDHSTQIWEMSTPNTSLQDIVVDDNGVIWARNNLELYRFNGSSWVVETFTSAGFTHPTNMWSVNEQEFIIRDNNDLFHKYDGSAWTQISPVTYWDYPSDLPDFDVYNVVEDNSGTTWFITGFGVVKKTAADDWTVWNDYTTSTILSARVRDFLEDDDGNVWVGTAEGISVLSEDEPVHYTIRTTNGGLGNNSILSLSKASDGAIWASTSSGTFQYLDGVWSQSDFQNDLESEIFQMPNGNLYTIIFNEVYRLENEQEILDFATTDVGEDLGLLRTFFIEADGKKWASYSNGLFYFDGITWEQIMPLGTLSQEGKFVYDFFKSPDGALWLGLNGEGILKFKNGEWTQFSTPNNSSVFTLTADLYGRIYGGLSTGILTIEGDNSTFQASNDAGILAGSKRNSLTTTEGVIWFDASQRGLNTLLPAGIAPIADFTYETEMLTATFMDNSSAAFSWLWTFGDGTTSTDQHPVHVYAATGDYEVCLIVTNDLGENTVCETVSVMMLLAPMANFTFETEMLEATFIDNSIDANSWVWDFGDGEMSTEQNPVYTYTMSGTYEVCLTASNDVGSDITCAMVTVLNTSTVDLATELGMNIYPNPIKETVFLRFAATPTDLNWSIYDVQGKERLTNQGQNIGSTSISINTSDLQSGMYYLKIINANGESAVRKIVK